MTTWIQTMIPCTNCGVAAPTTQQQGHYIDYGWSLGHDTLGHYGGFSDNFPSDGKLAHLCHDCCVKMLEALPGLAKFLFSEYGGHPNAQEDRGIETPSCCEYAWTWDEKRCDCGGVVVYHGAPNGGWRRQGCNRCELDKSEENVSEGLS